MPLDDVKTLAERILRLENKFRRIEERKGKQKPELFDNSAIRNRKIIDDLLVHNHVHADLLGLDADDHSQYLNTTRHDTTTRHTLGTVVPHDDHGSLSGLEDDDHTQYLNTTRHDITDRHTLGTVVAHDDHGSLSGLDDDDHTQYLNETRHDTTDRHTLGTVVPHDSHSSLSNLSDDDHSQYLNTDRHDITDRHTLGTVVPHDDHGSLSGLDDDDHTQYTKHPASSTDNAIARWDGSDGRILQNSGVTIDDSNNIKVGTAPVPTSVTSSTDNAVVRFDSTGGNKIQNSLVTINDNGDLDGKLINGMLINYQHVEIAPAADVYIKLATLPATSLSSWANIRMDGIIGGFSSGDIAMYSFFAGNRNGETFYFTYTGSKTAFYGARIRAYKRSTGELDICHFIPADSYTTFSANLSSFQGTIERSPGTFTPSGTRVFDSYEYTL